VVRTEFTYENNGASFQSGIDVGYYLSTNNLITTVDRRIGGASFSLGRADVYNGFINVAIPNDVNSGQTYWLGVIIDEDDSLSEAEEWNNATYTPIRIN
jgi:subtilase family serine protease